MKITLLASLMLLSLLLASGIANAQSNFCSSAIQDVTVQGLNNGENSILTISLAIVTTVLVILGITYGIGKAFGIAILIRFTQKEILESIFNLILILLAVGGLAFADKAVSFLSALSAYATSSTAAQTTVTSAATMYSTLCNNFMSAGLDQVSYAVDLILVNSVYSVIQTLTISIGGVGGALMPVAVILTPFKGIYPYSQFLSTEINATIGITLVYVGVAILAVVIYGLFPIFFYAGVLLRSIPWTRAAGGALLALFFSFYIVFPSLLLAFSQIQPQVLISSLPSITPSNVELSSQAFLNNPLAGIEGMGLTALIDLSAIFTGNFASTVSQFGSILEYAIFQLVGLIVSLLVSFDLLEGLGDLLGAPSLQSNRLLKNVI
ncbi:MAG: hypothetical protein ACP5T4_02660 [Candidatus Micrarchaeia archaeon]